MACSRPPRWEWWTLADLQHRARRIEAAAVAWRKACAIEAGGGRPVVFYREGYGWRVLDEHDPAEFEDAFVLKSLALDVRRESKSQTRRHAVPVPLKCDGS